MEQIPSQKLNVGFLVLQPLPGLLIITAFWRPVVAQLTGALGFGIP
jgi:hypothetical protein